MMNKMSLNDEFLPETLDPTNTLAFADVLVTTPLGVQPEATSRRNLSEVWVVSSRPTDEYVFDTCVDESFYLVKAEAEAECEQRNAQPQYLGFKVTWFVETLSDRIETVKDNVRDEAQWKAGC